MSAAGQSFNPDGWPKPIEDALERLECCSLAIERHSQHLFLFGTLLRAGCGILASAYLRSEASDEKLDRCILTDLRRPTFGNLVRFIDDAVSSRRVPWGMAEDIVSAFRALRSLRKPAGLRHSSRTIIDALLGYRNRTIHAGSGLTESEAMERLPGLEEGLGAVLRTLSVLREYDVTQDPEPLLVRGEASMPLVPGFERGEEQLLGALEGWDSRARTLRYVASAQEWESSKRWAIWTDLLRRRGLLPALWEAIDEAWLRARARALLPERYVFPPGFMPSPELLEQMDLCIGPDGRLAASDPSAAIALMCAGAEDRIVFVVSPEDKACAMQPEEGLTNLVGCEPGLREVPQGHPIEDLLAKVTIVFPAHGADGPPRWQRLESEFRGLRVVHVDWPREDEESFCFPASLLVQVGCALDGRPAPEGVQATDDTRRTMSNDTWDAIYLRSRMGSLSGGSPEWRERLDELLAEFVPESADPEAPAALHALTISPGDAPGRWRQMLLDLGLLETDMTGDLRFVDACVRARIYAHAVRIAPPRQSVRFLSAPPSEDDAEIAEVIRVAEKEKAVVPQAGSPGEALLVARKAVCGVSPAPAAPSRVFPLETLRAACRILVSWRRPDLVNELVLRHGCAQETAFATDPRLGLEVGQALRTHGAAETAIRFFETVLASIPGRDAPPLLQALAGTLRDRGLEGDRERAAGIYESLLARDDLDTELRIHVACGAAENLGRAGRFQEALRLLEETSSSAVEETPRLRAVIEHRLAAVLVQAGCWAEACPRSRKAVELLAERLQGSLAARVLDTHARCLRTLGSDAEAFVAAARSLSIKRALGDRRGIQMSLLLQSELQQVGDADSAKAAAAEAMELAVAAGDAEGVRRAEARLRQLGRYMDRRHGGREQGGRAH